jgi:hypothetical protein
MATGAPRRGSAVDRLESTNAEVRSLRTEFQRLKAVETGTNALRDPVEHPWPH